MKIITTINEARTLANIAERASGLFASGYAMKTLNADAGIHLVIAPAAAARKDANGHPMPPYLVDTNEGTCTCEAFARWDTCKHLQACEEEAGRVAWALAEYERSGRAEYEAFGRWL